MPSFNFVSSANAVVLRGAQPVFADIKPNTLNIDPADVERKITSNTRAIVPVHYAGVGCEMEALATLADRHDLTIVEDAAQAVDAYYQGDPLGTIGDIGCFSFHETKNITCGEGGAFLTNSTEIAEKAELAREKGTNRSAFLRGEVDKYTWVSPGSSYVQSDILAAVLEVQLQRREVIKERRRRVWEGYHEALAPELEETGFRLPVIPNDRESNYHIFYVLAPNQDLRDRLLERLKSNGVDATFHYIPLHSSPFGQTITPDDVSLPVTTECSNRLIRLPVYPQLSHRIEEVAERVRSVFSEMV